jgi:hypothetical protein
MVRFTEAEPIVLADPAAGIDPLRPLLPKVRFHNTATSTCLGRDASLSASIMSTAFSWFAFSGLSRINFSTILPTEGSQHCLDASPLSQHCRVLNLTRHLQNKVSTSPTPRPLRGLSLFTTEQSRPNFAMLPLCSILPLRHKGHYLRYLNGFRNLAIRSVRLQS